MVNLSPIEKWMVNSNLKTILEEGGDAKMVVAALKVNGYKRVAAGVEAALENFSKNFSK